MTDYNALLKQGWENIPEKRLLPVGAWLLKCTNISYQAAKSDDGNATVMAVFIPKEAMDDVDSEALAALLEGDYDLATNKLFYRVWIEDATSFNKVGKLLDDLGVDRTGKTLEESFKAAKGHEITGYVVQRQFKDKSGNVDTANDITQFSPVG